MSYCKCMFTNLLANWPSQISPGKQYLYKYISSRVLEFNNFKYLSTRIENKTENYYEVLGVAPTASQAQIKEAFYEISKEHHPDRQTSKISEEKFKNANQAYSVLSDEQERKLYDQQLRLSESPLGKQQYQMRQDYNALRNSNYKSEDFVSTEGRILVAKKNPISPNDLHKYGYNYELWSIGHYGKSTDSWMPKKDKNSEAVKRREAVDREMESLRHRRMGSGDPRARVNNSSSHSSSQSGTSLGLEAFLSLGAIIVIVGVVLNSQSS